jgi:hypothetical protein
VIIDNNRRIYPRSTLRDEYPSPKRPTMNIEGYQGFEIKRKKVRDL